jgi:hypothetical protein
MGIESKIVEILKVDWDPIGVGNNPDAEGEYNRYVYELMQVLLRNPSIEGVTEYLKDAEEYIGLPSSQETRQKVATKLLSIGFPNTK